MSFGEYCSELVKVCDKEASHALQIFSPSNEQNLSTIDMLKLNFHNSICKSSGLDFANLVLHITCIIIPTSIIVLHMIVFYFKYYAKPRS